jgi:hypothetical protein
MAANQVATLAQSLIPGNSYASIAISPMTVAHPAGASLQIGSNMAGGASVTLLKAANPGDIRLSITGLIPLVRVVSGVGIFDPTSSTGAGATASRPAGPNVGAQFYDTTLGKPIWWNGTNWLDAAGTIV